MDLSDQGFDLLFQREGKRNVAYLDSEGIVTIGIGHVQAGLVVGDVWTDDQVAEAFQKDSAWVKAALEITTSALEYNQYDALFSFIFNIGGGAWGSSTLLRMLNEQAPPDQVALQFDRWHIPPEITTRRNGEREQFKGTVFAARCDANGNPV